MKIKNLALAMIAFTFAIGGAFASIFGDEAVSVWAKSGQFISPSCIATTAACDSQESSSLCQLSITVANTAVSPQTVSSTGTLKTYKSGCSVVLFDHADRGIQNITASSSIYQVVAK